MSFRGAYVQNAYVQNAYVQNAYVQNAYVQNAYVQNTREITTTYARLNGSVEFDLSLWI